MTPLPPPLRKSPSSLRGTGVRSGLNAHLQGVSGLKLGGEGGGGVDLLSTSLEPSPDSRRRSKFLKDYHSKVNPDLATLPSLEEVTRSLKLSNNSSPGPDGISFAAWRAAPDLAAAVLWDVLKALLRGQSPPEGFNHGLLFLLPKKLTGLISDTFFFFFYTLRPSLLGKDTIKSLSRKGDTASNL